MNVSLWIFIIVAILVFNTYTEGAYMKSLYVNKKYYKIAGYIFGGLCVYLLVKSRPDRAVDLLGSASRFIHFIPMDKYSSALINPVLNLASGGIGAADFMANGDIYQQANARFGANMANNMHINPNTHNVMAGIPFMPDILPPATARIVTSGKAQNGKKLKRSVSEAKRKFVASQQNWRCGHCGQLLDASFEVDHKLALYKGGDNTVTNLEALCRNCHGLKTLKDRINDEVHTDI